MSVKAIAPARKRDEDIEKRVADLLPKDDENTLGKAYDPRLMRRLFEYMRPYKAKLVLAVAFMTVASLLSVAAPWIVGKAIDSGIRAGSLGALRFWIGVFIAAAVGEYVTNRARVRILAFVGTKIVADVRTALFRHLHTLSLTFYN
ncbi:MAG TPA: ABC transporter transmembrane domain-containing protein, partial [Herpetosiphonaceae bacterium]|nr:ABC transporter transmembrane domain-containing protein [Herpetosiphonaceae bacterium]